MRSFIFNSNRPSWRRFFLYSLFTALVCVGILYGFVVLVDPFDTLPLSPPAERWPVATNARFAFPALARATRFDSAVFGTSTSRLLRPVVLNRALDAHFVNLAMNDATAYEQARLMDVFRRAHPDARFVLVGLDVRWCVTGETYPKLTRRPFPAWMYGENQWAGYAHMLNMYAIQEAGQLFGILVGIKKPVYGRDGFTSFVPPDSEYDPVRVAEHLQRSGPDIPHGERSGPPASWHYPALETLESELRRFPPATQKLVFFVPYNHVLLSPAGTPGAPVWSECKRHVAQISRAVPNMIALDFMRASPITDNDDNYWDGLHYRLGIGERISRDIGAGAAGRQNPDFRILADQDEGDGGT